MSRFGVFVLTHITEDEYTGVVETVSRKEVWNNVETARLLKVLGDETRLRMLHLLREGELCVCDLMELLGLSQPNASRHLNRLREAGLVSCERRAQWMHYRLHLEAFARSPFLAALLEELPKERLLREDGERLRVFMRTKFCNGADGGAKGGEDPETERKKAQERSARTERRNDL